MSRLEPEPMSEETRKRLQEIAKSLEGKELFPEAVARAKKMFANMKESPKPPVKEN